MGRREGRGPTSKAREGGKLLPGAEGDGHPCISIYALLV